MTSLVYLLSLAVVLVCMALTDRRWHLFFWADPRRAAVVFASGFGLFLVWDLVALNFELYERGRSELMTGLEVAPELPVEELFFVAFLPYLTMVLHGLGRRMLMREGAP
ncbi:MAG TPA: lycopene cyclase domain-containing protein [Marmoricola sp.]|nr:lycopene cyclase domain-containing protein [Marmoricola sp.]